MELLSHIYEKACQQGKLTPDPIQIGVLPHFDRLMRDLVPKTISRLPWRKPPPPTQGLYLWGNVGRGKTFLMDLFQRHCPAPTLREHTNTFLLTYFSKMAARHTPVAESVMLETVKELRKKAKVLCLDEFQVYHIGDAMLLSRILRLAFQEGMVLVATSNTAPNHLYPNGLHREYFLPFIEVLLNHVQEIPLEGEKDYRLETKSVEDLYLLNKDPETPRRLTDIWHQLSPNPNAKPGTLSNQGRQIAFQRLDKGVAWASFKDLCGKPLGSSDYLAISQQLSALILTDIPVLEPEQFNEAVRFIKLVDLLYEAKVVTVFSADAPIDDLYTMGKRVEVFARTRSRLKEMKSWPLP